MLPGDTNACNRGKKGTNKHRATLIIVKKLQSEDEETGEEGRGRVSQREKNDKILVSFTLIL